jgi:hypothetical protein
MYIIDTKSEEVYKEFPYIKSWIETICESIIEKEMDDCKIDMFYHYGFFVPKVSNKQDYYIKQYDMYSQMKFDERLEYELSKTRVNVTVKIDNFMMTNRLKKGEVPSIVSSIVTEITKYKMMAESEFHENQEIKDSIPAVDNNLVSIELVKSLVSGKEEVDETEFDLDDVLEKISKQGMDSLSEKEKEFLDKKSKEM